MLAIAGGKGGCGKTTTTLGLAAALDGSVLAVDADVDMPNLHRLAGIDAEVVESADSTAPARSDPASEPNRYAHPDHPHVSIRPASGDADVDAVLEPFDRDPETTTLVDCPAGAGPDAAAALRAADAALLVSPLCRAALRDTAKTAAMARTLGTDPVGVVLTRTRFRPDPVTELLGCPALAAVPRVDPPVLPTPVVRAAYERLASKLVREEDIL